jgi:RNA polymerase sigma factor (sigma-70 family)
MKFNEFYSKEYKNVVRHLNQKLRNELDAEDMAQVIFMKMLAKWDTIDTNISSHRTYLFRVVNNTLIDHFRVKRIQNTVSIESGQGNENENRHEVAILTASSNPVQEMIGNEYKEALKEVLNSLPILHKKCAIMYLNGFKLKEIAERLNTTTGTICPLVRNLRQKFQKAYELV